MKKKVVAMFLAAVMALSLVACGSKSDNGGSGDASGTETIKLGGVGPLTGGYANYGLSVQHGAELAVKEINAAGGVNGKQLEVNFQDSQGDPESAVAAYGKLMDWGMNVCLGGVLSGETASVVAAAKADDMFIMETTGSADKCIDGNDKAFRICFYDSYQGTAAADYLTDNALATEVGVFYQSDNDYSVGLYNAFVAECQNTGVTIKETQTFTTATSTDFSTQVNALASSGVKVVFIPIYAEEASTFLTQAKGKFAGYPNFCVGWAEKSRELRAKSFRVGTVQKSCPEFLFSCATNLRPPVIEFSVTGGDFYEQKRPVFFLQRQGQRRVQTSVWDGVHAASGENPVRRIALGGHPPQRTEPAEAESKTPRRYGGLRDSDPALRGDTASTGCLLQSLHRRGSGGNPSEADAAGV